MNSVSKQCLKEISALNDLMNKAINEIEIARSRAQSAEKMLQVIKESASAEIKNAYLLGYQNAKNEVDDNSGGRKDEEDKKLVLKTD